MTKNNKILHDISKVASSTVATMVNIKNDLATYISHQIKAALKGMDVVSKTDFQALKKSVETINHDVKSLHHPKKVARASAVKLKKVAKKTKAASPKRKVAKITKPKVK